MPGFLAKLDRFTIGLIVSVGAGILVPCSGVWDTVFSRLSDAAIVLLFFLYGAKLSRRSVWEGVMHWRLQGLVAASTFVIFPLLGMVSMPLWNSVLGPDLCMGMLYVCMLPSTVQSSIAFTSMAGGNVAAAICSASVSSLLGVFLTPLLVGLVWSRGGEGGVDFSTFLNICYIILVPFVAGQFAQRWIGKWVVTHRNLTSWTDHSTIWLVIYTAFSHAMINGVWKNLPWLSLVEVLAFCGLLLAAALWLTAFLSRRLRFSREDRIAIIFCGSKKSLATGIPMMNVIFAGAPIGLRIRNSAAGDSGPEKKPRNRLPCRKRKPFLSPNWNGRCSSPSRNSSGLRKWWKIPGPSVPHGKGWERKNTAARQKNWIGSRSSAVSPLFWNM